MKLERLVGKLLLLSSAIALTACVVSAQRTLNGTLNGSPTSNSTKVIESVRLRTQKQSSGVRDMDWLANLVGVTQFVKNPTQYKLAMGENLGQVTSAFLNEDVMTIDYQFLADGEVKAGELTGTVNSDGLFTGNYEMQSQNGLLKGSISLSFVADGTAEGKYDNNLIPTRLVM